MTTPDDNTRWYPDDNCPMIAPYDNSNNNLDDNPDDD
jgi:hypothetical protein